MPLTTTWKGTPRAVCAWGSKKTSDVAYGLVGHPVEVGAGQVAEVLLSEQNGHALVVDIEEVLQVRETVSVTGLVHGGKGQSDSIALGNGQHQLRLESTFDVDVQFGFG